MTYPKPSYLAICTCGKEAIIYFDQNADDFVPSDSTWVFSYQNEGDNQDSRGWNCGAAGHDSKTIDHTIHELSATVTIVPVPQKIVIAKKKTPKNDDQLSLF